MLPTVIPVRQRRRFSREFKQHLVDQCQPGVSVAAVAMANDINPNQLQRWIRECRAEGGGLPLQNDNPLKLVPLSVQQATPLPDSMIEIQVERKGGSVRMRWPASSALILSNLLTDWLK